VAVKLRLVRMGKKKQPTYRVVAADSRSPRDGRFLEILAPTPPWRSTAEPDAVVLIDNAKALKWLSQGPSRPSASRSCSRPRVPGRVHGGEGQVSVEGEGYVEGDVNVVEDDYADDDVNEIDDYEDGDVNAVIEEDLDDDDEIDAAEGANRSEGGTPTAVLGYLARSLANEPESVVVHTEARQGSVRLRLHVAPRTWAA